jgi:hypothetical protein
VSELVEFWRPYGDVLGFVVAGVLAYVLIKGLQQVELAKKAINVTNERASKERALEYLNFYATDVIPKWRMYYSAASAPAVAVEPSYKGPVGDFSPSSLTSSEELTKKLGLVSGVDFRNALEVFAVAFTSGVADEGLGFEVNGRAFCGMVAAAYDQIASSRRQTTEPKTWSPIVNLYLMWSKRLSQAELEVQRKKLDADVKALGTAAVIHPIGVTPDKQGPPARG